MKKGIGIVLVLLLSVLCVGIVSASFGTFLNKFFGSGNVKMSPSSLLENATFDGTTFNKLGVNSSSVQTISFWAKGAGWVLSAHQHLWDYNSFAIAIGNNRVEVYGLYGWNSKLTASVLDISSWNHYVLVNNGNLHALYVNGALVANAETLAVQDWPIVVGSAGYNAVYYDYMYKGKVSKVNVVNSALSATDILGIYNSQKAEVLGEVVPVATCTDSDVNATYPDGKNYDLKGNLSVKALSGWNTFTDSCKIVTSTTCDSISCGGSIVDSCSGSNCVVDEYICDPISGGVGHSPYYCQSGCSNGACLPASSNTTIPVSSCNISSSTCVLYEGGEVNPLGYSVKIASITSSTVKFMIDGVNMVDMNEGTALSVNGIRILVNDILYSSKDGEVSGVKLSYFVDASAEPSPTFNESYKIRATDYRTGERGVGVDSMTIQKYVNDEWIDACTNYMAGDDCTIGNLVINIISVSSSAHSTHLSITSEGQFDYNLHTTFGYQVQNTRNIEFYSSSLRWVVASEPRPSCNENYKLRATNFKNEVGVTMVTLQKYVNGAWVDSCVDVIPGYECTIGNLVVLVEGITYGEDKLANLRVIENGKFDYGQGGPYHQTFAINNNGFIFSRNNDDWIVASVCSSSAQVCSSFIDSIKNPVSTNEKRLNWNSTYSGVDGVNNRDEPFTTYSAGWYWNNPVYDPNQLNYYYVQYEVQVFDNKNINLSERMSWDKTNPACKVNSNGMGGKSDISYYYICNWDSINGRQDVSDYKGENRQISWYQGNVIVRMYIYYGLQLTDTQVAKISQIRLNELINNLQNNGYKYVDWSNFDIQYPAVREVYDSLNSCSSDLSFNWSRENLGWECRLEPIICPPHGEQSNVCRAWDGAKGEYVTQTSTQWCNPGICSGCMAPKWFGSTYDEKCLPYGFRFAQTQGQSNQLGEGVDLTENGQVEINLTILDVNKAHLYINYTLNYGDSGDKIFDRDLYVGDTYDLPDIGEVISFRLDKIIQASNGEKGYIQVTLLKSFNSYCDADGRIYEQKTTVGGEWAKCQNNYECTSNICSEGECIPVAQYLSQGSGLKKFFVNILCFLAHPLDGDPEGARAQCINEALA